MGMTDNLSLEHFEKLLKEHQRSHHHGPGFKIGTELMFPLIETLQMIHKGAVPNKHDPLEMRPIDSVGMRFLAGRVLSELEEKLT